MSPNQIKTISRKPKAMMDFLLSGRLPTERPCPSTPLRELIETIPVDFWDHINGITLNPSLGFSSNMQFNNLYQLATWLGYNKTSMHNQRMPYQSWKISNFKKKLFIDDLLNNSTKHIDTSILKANTRKSLWRA